MNPDAVDALLSTGSDVGDTSKAVDTDPDDEVTSSEMTAGDTRVPHGSTDDPELLDFSANTNPRLPEGATRIYQTALASARSYPSDDYCSYRITAGEFVGCDPELVVPTAGGLAAIRLAIQTVVRPEESVLIPTPSFAEYAREVRLQGGTPVFVDHDELLETEPADHAMVILCNPNNPTGDAVDPTAIRAFADRCRATDTVLLVDEAFLGFTAEPSLAGRDGVIVARSLTKLFGLPGLRAGFAVATGQLHDRLEAARLTWSLSGPAAAVGDHCMAQTAFVERTRERVASERARMRERLGSRFDVFPSDAPFLLVDAGTSDAVEETMADARRQDVVLRDARTFRGLDSHFRVAVRLPEENDRLLAALDV